MQFEFMLIFIIIWLLSLWIGSITLEATGMERTKARFQALSALTGSGFTTREAESVVNHPHRRFIVSWLMFIGNAGLIIFILALILYLRSNLTSMSLIRLGVIVGIIVALALFIWLGAMDKISTRMVRWFRRKGHLTPDISTEILHHAGDYSIARLTIGEKAPQAGCKISDTSLTSITILAIERGDKTLPFPEAKEIVLAGDHLLCYGETAQISRLVQ